LWLPCCPGTGRSGRKCRCLHPWSRCSNLRHTRHTRSLQGSPGKCPWRTKCKQRQRSPSISPRDTSSKLGRRSGIGNAPRCNRCTMKCRCCWYTSPRYSSCSSIGPSSFDIFPQGSPRRRKHRRRSTSPQHRPRSPLNLSFPSQPRRFPRRSSCSSRCPWRKCTGPQDNQRSWWPPPQTKCPPRKPRSSRRWL
jgi:hypothetical protein